MKQTTETQLAKMILLTISTAGKCVIDHRLLDEVFDQRSDQPNKLKPLFDPSRERLATFCNRYQLVIVPGNVHGRTIFAERTTTIT
jgi:hypothetical protein